MIIQTSKQPITINKPFRCKHCGAYNPEAPKTCRNHCRKCLFSLHVDKTTPGDRKSSCHGLMAPVQIRKSGGKGLQILHECLKCPKKILNITAEDDDPDAIMNVMQQHNISLSTHHGRKKS